MLPKISEAESRVMALLWEKSPLSANDIVEKLENQVDWNAQTIRTLINRLVQKGAIDYDKDGRSYLYYPKVNENEYRRAERQSFLSRVYSGSLKPMLAAFIEDEQLSPEDIAELKRILEQKENEK